MVELRRPLAVFGLVLAMSWSLAALAQSVSGDNDGNSGNSRNTVGTPAGNGVGMVVFGRRGASTGAFATGPVSDEVHLPPPSAVQRRPASQSTSSLRRPHSTPGRFSSPGL